MSRIIEVNEFRTGSITSKTNITKLLLAARVEQVVSSPGGAIIFYRTRSGKLEKEVVESASDVAELVNDPNVTASEQQLIELTVNRIGGYNAASGGFPQTRQVLVADIYEVNQDLANPGNSIVTLESPTDGSFKDLFVEQSVSDINTAANS